MKRFSNQFRQIDSSLPGGTPQFNREPLSFLANPSPLFCGTVQMSLALLLCFSYLGNHLRADPPSFKVVAPPANLLNLDQSFHIHSAQVSKGMQHIEFRVPGRSETTIGIIQDAPVELPEGVPFRLRARLADPKSGTLHVQPKLEALAVWDDAAPNVFADNKYDNLKEVLGRIPRDSTYIPDTLHRDIQDATINAIVATPSGTDAASQLVHFYYLQEKSYRGDQQIRFNVFDKARETCLTACGIRANGRERPHGSGVLIGDGLVLTCWHNLTGVAGGAANCQLMFQYTSDGYYAVFSIDRVLYKSEDKDFCLLTVGDLLFNKTESTHFELPKATTLGIVPELGLNEGIYVAGHPRGDPLSVALSGRVVYPYWVASNSAIQEMVERAILNMFSTSEEYVRLLSSVRPQVQAFFAQSYHGNETHGYRLYVQNIPTIGADPDTKRGDSGAPVFDVRRNSLVGMLRSGKPEDGHLPRGPTIRYFEQVLPLSQIVKDLDGSDELKDWRLKYGVQFLGQ